jgi:subtilisin family serine protease
MKKNILLSFLLLHTLFAFAQSSLRHKAGELLVSLSPTAKIETVQANLQARYGENLHCEAKLVSETMNIWHVTYNTNVVRDEEIRAQVQHYKEVRIVQYNHELQFRNNPNDSLLSKQWQWINTTNSSSSTADADIDAELAWDITTGGVTPKGDTIVVAIIDDGISLSHPDLKPNLWRNKNEIAGNGLDDDGNGYIDDVRGWNIQNSNDNVGVGSHGVEVAGMIGAKGNNTKGVTGINWNVKLMSIAIQTIDEANAISGYAYALKMRTLYNQTKGKKGAFVVVTNSSFGIDNAMPQDAPIWCEFYDSLGVHGILNVAATVNQDINVDIKGDIPTTCTSDYLLTVTGSTPKDQKASSGYGKISIDVAAPSTGVFTTLGNSQYTATSGTSFAAPIVAGLAALMYAAPCTNFAQLSKQNPAAAALEIKKAIMAGVDSLAAFDTQTASSGRVNAFKAIKKLTNELCSACPKPLYPIAINPTTTKIELTWTAFVPTDLRWRKKGTTTFTTLTNVSSPLIIDTLKACTEYEYELKSVCTGVTSTFGQTYFFKTDGCCAPPSDLHVTFLTDSTAILAWNKVLAAKSYTLRYRPDSQGAWQMTEDDLLRLLKPCTEYEIQIQSVCDTGKTNFSESTFFKTSGCGACEDKAYCVASAQNPSLTEWIGKVQIGDWVNTSNGSDKGYEDYTGGLVGVPTFLLNTSYTMTVVPMFGGSTYKEYIRAWIDFNQNGFLEDTNGEMVLDAGTASPDSLVKDFIVPSNAKLGITRLRVVLRYKTAPFSCETFDYGEVEDYCVNIQKMLDINNPIDGLRSVALFPNPFSNTLSLKFNLEKSLDLRIQLLNNLGQVIQNQHFKNVENGQSLSLDASQLPAGMYLVQVISDKGVVVIKGVKE